MKILLVAKPWRGGLANYLYQSLNDVLPNQVSWVHTYPSSMGEHLLYRKNKSDWLNRLVDQINCCDYDVAIFVNHLKIFHRLRTDRRHVLWITDAPQLKSGEDAAFQRIFLSDTGYESALLNNIDHVRYQGELAFACYPKVHKPIKSGSKKTQDVCFIGNKDPLRDNWLSYFLSNRLNIDVYGNYFLRTALFWRHPFQFHPSISNVRMQAVYAKYSISMNIHAKVVKHGTNMRTFECAAYQIPQVVDSRPGLARFFGADALMESKSPEQMLMHIHTLLGNLGMADKMALRARQIVLSQHTYYHRLSHALQGWLTPEVESRFRDVCANLIEQNNR